MTENKEKTSGLIQFIMVIIFIIASIAISKILQFQYSPPISNGGKEKVLFVNSFDIAPKDHRIKFEVSGMVQARSKIDILPQVSGRVIWVSDKFFAGGKFKKNETLFQIDPKDYELEVKSVKAELAKAKTALQLEEVERDSAIAEWKQFNPGAKIPPLVARNPQYEQAKADLLAAKSRLENAMLDLKRTKVKMPFNGRVLSSDVGVGKFLNSGQSYGQVFDLKDLEVISSLNSKQLNWLLSSSNPKIKITINYLGESYDFFSKFLRSSASFDSLTRFSKVAFSLNKKNSKIKILPGTFAKVLIEGAKLKNVTIAPASSLQKGGIIWRINQENRIEKFLPNIVYSDDEIIIFDNLDEKAKIVSSKIAGGIKGMKVSFANNSKINSKNSKDEQ